MQELIDCAIIQIREEVSYNFDPKDIKEVEYNAGSIFITLNNGVVYTANFTILKCEED